MRQPVLSAPVRRECRKVAQQFRPLVEAALDQRAPSEALRQAVAVVLSDPVLAHYLEAAA